MIDRYKAIVHDSTTLDYIFREGKLGSRFAFRNLCDRDSKTIYEEVKVVSNYNSRCRSKFFRTEIGVASQDGKRLPVSEPMWIAHLFIKRMRLDNHQWMAVMRKGTDNRHIHIIVSRVSLYGEVYDTTFVSNRVAKVAEEISREKGLAIVKEVRAEKKYQKTKASPMREQTKKEVQQICYSLFGKHKRIDIAGHSMFLCELSKRDAITERMESEQGKAYGLKFPHAGQSFRASGIGREFGYRSLRKNFESTSKEEPKRPYQTVQESTENNKQSDTGYQPIPKSYSTVSRDNDTPRVQSSISAVADTIISVADEVVEGLGNLIIPSVLGYGSTEAA